MKNKPKRLKPVAAKPKSQPQPIIVESKNSLSDIVGVENPQLFRALPDISDLARSQKGVQFKWNHDGSTSAGPCATTASQAQSSYRCLLPEFHQARTFVIRRAKMGVTPTPSQLREHLKGTKLSTCADDDDLANVIVTCSQTDERLPRPEKLTLTFLVDKMGLTPKTLKSYFSRVEKEPPAKK